ncbi:MAG: hypothetical protein ACPG4T_22460, partial [Nannocystaceae bacterium]
ATAQEILEVLEVFAAADGSSAQGTSTLIPNDTVVPISGGQTNVPLLAASSASQAPAGPLNTVQLMERARQQSREISVTAAIAVLVSMSLLAAAVTYLVRILNAG